jgi:hypothetical protein
MGATPQWINMAHPHAIAAIATALLRLLARDCPRDGFRSEPTFSLRHLGQPRGEAPGEGLSLWVWRIQPTSTATRATPVRAPDGVARPPDLVVDLSILIGVRAAEAEQELQLTGWLMRWLADHPVLSPDLLRPDSGAALREPLGAGESLTLLLDLLTPEDRRGLAAVDGGRWMGAVPCCVRGLRLVHSAPAGHAG